MLVFSMYKRVFVIIAFDLVKMSLSEIPLFDNLTMKSTLDNLTMKNHKVLSLRVIWVMKEYKVQSSWTKWFVILTYGFSPICITKDGGILG